MKLVCLTLLVLLLVLDRTSGDNDWYEDEEQDEDTINHEDKNPSILSSEEEQPDLICEKAKMCTCKTAMKNTKEINVVHCSHASLKNEPLDTAHLMIRQVGENKGYKAEEVRLDHNNIIVLREGMIMPGQEEHILSLDFSYNRIMDVEKKTFENFPKLLKLKLTHNRLRNEEISDDWLTKQLGRSLHQLYLDYNYITRLDDGIFDNLSNLTKLVLDGNRGLRLTPATFGNKALKKLRTLSLDNCGLQKLDDDIFVSLESLAFLSLSGNDFSTIPLALSKVPKLTILAMSDTGLQTLGKHSFKLNPQLKNIYLRKMSHLESVEECAFCGLSGLEVVDFTGSKKLSDIDEVAFGMFSKKEILPDNLKTLLLADCNLKSVSENLVEWSNIEQFTLSGNPLVCDCTKMQWLMGNQKKHLRFGKDKPTCTAPEPLKGMELKDADAKACGHVEPSSNQKMTLVVVLVGLCASVFIVGFFYARSKGGVRQFLPVGRPASPQLGYSNLTRGGPAHNDLDDGDENRLEDDFNRPEFV